MHLRDMIDVEMVDETRVQRFASPLAERLQHLFDNPEKAGRRTRLNATDGTWNDVP
ncbi:MAG: hypothetical protein AAFP90_17695 [Planctomycetota bacterium]